MVEKYYKKEEDKRLLTFILLRMDGNVKAVCDRNFMGNGRLHLKM